MHDLSEYCATVCHASVSQAKSSAFAYFLKGIKYQFNVIIIII